MRKQHKIIALLALLISFAAIQPSVAQKGLLQVVYNNGKPAMNFNTDSVIKIDFEYNTTIYNTLHVDTIWFTPAAGVAGIGLPVLHSGEPITIEEDYDWFDVELTRYTTDSTSTSFNYNYTVYASINDSDKERYGSFKIKSGNKEIVQQVAQSRYVSSFSTAYLYGGEIEREINVNIPYNQKTYSIGVLPGFGIKLLSYPKKWIKAIECVNNGEGNTTPSKNGLYTYVTITTEDNFGTEPHTGIVVLEDKNGEQLIINLTKETLKNHIENNVIPQITQGYLVYGSQVHETDMAYPAYMIAQTELLGDMFPSGDSGFDWYYAYNATNYNMGDNSYPALLCWSTFYKFIDTANSIIGMLNGENVIKSDYINSVIGSMYAYRAFCYYMLTVFYEPKANIYTDCTDVLGLTVPIVTESTTNEIAENNPRATHDEMISFIISDLEKAEGYLKNYTPDNKKLPNLAVVYGIRAKVHMWDEDYENAAKYARMAIEGSDASPVTDAQWNDPITGFNTANQAWMWYANYDAENMGNLCNFVGWMSSEETWGYSSLTQPVIDRSLYEKIADTDFRKKSFVDPDRKNKPRESVRGADWLAYVPNYLALKFRCGNGDYQTYSVGGATEVPIMRIEEMYLIRAEAVAHTQGVIAGKMLLEEFMQQHRDASYKCSATDLRELQLDILTQMRIEFWGEGCAFQQAKRIQPGIMQNYTGTNAHDDYAKVNCYGMKPTWNMVIPKSAMTKNRALINNPNPTGTVLCPSEENVYAPGNY